MFFHTRIGSGFLLIAASILTSGCALNRTSLVECDMDRCFQIPSVPFIEQKDDFCGPASLAMVMNFYGANVTQDEIAKEIYSPELKGTLSMELVLYPIKKGFEAEMYNGNLDDLKQKVRAVSPLIVSVKEREDADRAHYMVVWGYDDKDKKIFAHTGRKERIAIRYEDFIEMWKRAGFLTVWMYPKGEAHCAECSY